MQDQVSGEIIYFYRYIYEPEITGFSLQTFSAILKYYHYFVIIAIINKVCAKRLAWKPRSWLPFNFGLILRKSSYPPPPPSVTYLL